MLQGNRSVDMIVILSTELEDQFCFVYLLYGQLLYVIKIKVMHKPCYMNTSDENRYVDRS